MEISRELDRRIQRSQTALTNALLSLLSEKSLQDISVNAITERANVNRSTFYAHYTDKYDLFQTCVRLIFADALHEQLPEPCELRCDTLKHLIVVTCEFFGRPGQGSCTPKHKQLDPIVETEIQSVLYDYLLDWLQSNLTSPESTATLEMRALIMSWAIFGAGIEYRYRANGRTPEDIAEAAYAILAQRVLPVAE